MTITTVEWCAFAFDDSADISGKQYVYDVLHSTLDFGGVCLFQDCVIVASMLFILSKYEYGALV